MNARHSGDSIGSGCFCWSSTAHLRLGVKVARLLGLLFRLAAALDTLQCSKVNLLAWRQAVLILFHHTPHKKAPLILSQGPGFSGRSVGDQEGHRDQLAIQDTRPAGSGLQLSVGEAHASRGAGLLEAERMQQPGIANPQGLNTATVASSRATINLDRLDEQCALPGLVANQPRQAGRINAILNNSFGMLGINAVVIVKRV